MFGTGNASALRFLPLGTDLSPDRTFSVVRISWSIETDTAKTYSVGATIAVNLSPDKNVLRCFSLLILSPERRKCLAKTIKKLITQTHIHKMLKLFQIRFKTSKKTISEHNIQVYSKSLKSRHLSSNYFQVSNVTR